MKGRGTYSVCLGGELAADWAMQIGWDEKLQGPVPEKWTVSERDGVQWFACRDLGECDLPKILEHFKLPQGCLTLEQVRTMDPLALWNHHAKVGLAEDEEPVSWTAGQHFTPNQWAGLSLVAA